jgi:hypothetical protein
MVIRDCAERAVEERLRNCWAKVMFGLNPKMRSDTDFHSLPPEPEDEVRSKSKSSQGPNSLAREITTLGELTTNGAEAVRFCASLELQLEQEGSTFEVQRAFSTLLLNNSELPRLKSVPIEEISKVESLVHTQRAVEGRAIGDRCKGYVPNSLEQLSALSAPPLFVGVLNITLSLLPSEENSKLWTIGGGELSSTPFTNKTSPAGNTTLKSILEGPPSEAFKR